MIKIEPLFATDYEQMRALLRYSAEFLGKDDLCRNESMVFRGLTFWQHWLPYQLHLAPSVYVAKEDGVVLGLISLRATGKAKSCWQIDNLVVHPLHRSRGVAHELLAFAFALLGSQGVSHFIAEISDQNQAALELYASAGFRRLSKLTYYQMHVSKRANDKKSQTESLISNSNMRLAVPSDKKGLFALNQDILPLNIRYVFAQTEEDFAIFELPIARAEKLRRQIAQPRSFWWVVQNEKRGVITAAVRITSHKPDDYHLEICVHPGWMDQQELVTAFAVESIAQTNPHAELFVKVYEYQSGLENTLESFGFDRAGGFCLLLREHWEKAKNAKELPTSVIKALPKAAINLPLVSD